jgi:hypothetical protein
MPPRRSCFGEHDLDADHCAKVSMPPRRSCFAPPPRGIIFPGQGFNATTAFLLPVLDRAVRSLEAEFQCHHGVPASPLAAPDLPGVPGFNATTAFLLHYTARALDPLMIRFQCHHGVPASWEHAPEACQEDVVSMPPRRSCFTGRGGRCPGTSSVSMPPRRSCFPS